MNNRGLFLLIMCIYTISVLCDDDSNNKEKSEVEFFKPKYQFNHPPSSEYFNPIPVAVIYDDNNGYSEKPEMTKKALEIDDHLEANATEKNVHASTEQQETTTVFVNRVDSKIGLIPKSRALNDMQIPVALVYDTDLRNSQDHHGISAEIDSKTSRRRLNRRGFQQTKTNVNNPKEQSPKQISSTQLSKADIITPQPSIQAKAFKKRTEGRDPVVPILESENYVFSHRGNFRYRYEGGDGTKAYSEGNLRTVDDHTGEAVIGGFSYTDKDGNDFSLSYTADENGYRPVGAHLPTPPPIPPEIARALEYLATATPEPSTKRPPKPKALVR